MSGGTEMTVRGPGPNLSHERRLARTSSGHWVIIHLRASHLNWKKPEINSMDIWDPTFNFGLVPQPDPGIGTGLR